MCGKGHELILLFVVDADTTSQLHILTHICTYTFAQVAHHARLFFFLRSFVLSYTNIHAMLELARICDGDYSGPRALMLYRVHIYIDYMRFGVTLSGKRDRAVCAVSDFVQKNATI